MATREDKGDFVSGFRPYPTQGFQIQPQANYWQGNNFHMPGINPGAPQMTSNMMQQFPQLSNILSMRSPPMPFQGVPGGGPFSGAPFVGAPTSPVSPTQALIDSLKGKKKKTGGSWFGVLDQMRQEREDE